MADDGDHVAANARNQTGPSRLSHLRVEPPQTLYNAFEFATGESDTNPQTVHEKLDEYFTGEIDETM